METKRPIPLKVAAILLVVLTVVNVGAVVIQQYGWWMPSNVVPNTRWRQPAQDWDENRPRDDQRLQSLPDSPQARIFRPGDSRDFPSTGRMLLPILWQRVGRLISLWGGLVALALAILAAVGVWKGKGWGVTLAILLVALVLLTTLFAMFPLRPLGFIGLSQVWQLFAMFGLNVVKVLLALAVLVLLLLPVSRRTYRASLSS